MISDNLDLHYDDLNRNKEPVMEIQVLIQCITVHQMIKETFKLDVSDFTVKTKYEWVDLSSFFDEGSSTSSLSKIFKKPKDRVVSAWRCTFFACQYDIFLHPTNFLISFVTYKCKNFPKGVVYIKEKK